DIRSEVAQTQNLNITEQLQHGIRYLDIRLETNKNMELYLSHGSLDCYNKVTGGKYYLSEVFDEIINFLNKHNTETVIVHLKNENIYNDNYSTNVEIVKRIVDLTINNTNVVPFNKDKKYKDYYYNESKTLSTLEKAKVTDQFYDIYDNDVLTIDFMNVAVIGDWYDIFDSSTIDSMSSEINKHLVDFNMMHIFIIIGV
ncbi:PLC-like phosphodiesterase, partial [Piromyces finnis]